MLKSVGVRAVNATMWSNVKLLQILSTFKILKWPFIVMFEQTPACLYKVFSNTGARPYRQFNRGLEFKSVTEYRIMTEFCHTHTHTYCINTRVFSWSRIHTHWPLKPGFMYLFIDLHWILTIFCTWLIALGVAERTTKWYLPRYCGVKCLPQ